MRSPFPGMDPYLEQSWRDVHTRLITYTSDALQRRLPEDLRARVEEQVYIENPAGRDRQAAPDIRVVERSKGWGQAPFEEAEGGVAVALAEPLVIQIREEEIVERSIHIIDIRSGGRVVTVIEILSRTNKTPGKGQDLYLKKQQEMLSGDVNLVEIDLLRGGQRLLALAEDRIPASHRTPYRVCAHRAYRPDEFEIYRVPLRERLPILPIPLREQDRDVPLDLQALIDQSYANGGYDDIDYKVAPDLPLDPDDAAWADALLREKGLR
ncbi:DUF4058 family protein [soil metagenome]